MVVCRTCKNINLYKVLSLGDSPLANNFLTDEQLKLPETRYPLELFFCDKCGLVQLGYVVPPKEMYSNYLYIPSTSETFSKHLSEMAEDLTNRFSVNMNDLVVDIGGNDGTLLKTFKKFGINVLNVEPAENIAEISRRFGIETIIDYFSEKLAKEIVKEKGKTKVIIGTNVFTHINDLDDILKGVDVLLADDGIFVIEVYYLGDIIRNVSFDIIYHEHLSYFTVYSLKNLFKKFGFEIFDVKKVSTHGGSLRVFVCREGVYRRLDSVDALILMEKEMKLHSKNVYRAFAQKIDVMKQKLLDLLHDLKSQGKRIVGYGAPAKSTTLLNYFGIGKDVLDYIVDKSPLKQNRYTPGTHIQIFPPEKLLDDKPDYVLILAWNVSNEIIQQQEIYHKSGGKFIIPVPEPKII